MTGCFAFAFFAVVQTLRYRQSSPIGPCVMNSSVQGRREPVWFCMQLVPNWSAFQEEFR